MIDEKGENGQRVYELNPKHKPVRTANIAAAPKNGQAALDASVQVKETSTRRVGVDTISDEIVVFDEHAPNIFHGHVRIWDELRPEMQNALKRAELVDSKGRMKNRSNYAIPRTHSFDTRGSRKDF